MYTTTKNGQIPSLLNELVNFSFDKVFNEDYQNTNVGYKAPTNILELGDAYQLSIAAPGRKKEDFNVSVEEGLLTISTKTETTDEASTNADEKWLKREFKLQPIKRSFKLSDKVNGEAIKANYENGILTIELPKKEAVKAAARLIEIS